MAPDCSVIIVTYDAADHVVQCIESVLGAGGEGVDDVEVIVVDNRSSDGTPALVRERFGDVLVVDAGRNGGFGAGTNVGLRVARGDAILSLNPDAELERGALARLLEELEREPQAGVAVPRMRHPDGCDQRSLRRFPTTWRYATELLGLRRIAPGSRLLNGFYCGDLDPDRSAWVDWATGACLLVRRRAIDDAGLLDESLFMYGEEVEWLHRLGRAGWRTRYVPAAGVRHVGGGSARRSWSELYGVQLANHVRQVRRIHGTGPARRTRRLLLAALALRAVAWRAASLRPGVGGERRAQLRERAGAALRGRRAVAALDLSAPDEQVVPPWDGPVDPAVAVQPTGADPR